MKRSICIALLMLAAGLVACSSYKFFGYSEDTGLYVIEHPTGYSSSRFGQDIVYTNAYGVDMMAVAAGMSSATAFYKLAEDGKIKNVKDPFAEFPESDSEIKSRKSASSIAGLPTWWSDEAKRVVQGCVAISQHGKESDRRVRIECYDTEYLHQNLMSPNVAGDGSELDPDDFGHKVAAIRPSSNETWLLAMAAEEFIVVAGGSPEYYSEAVEMPRGNDVVDLVGGRGVVALPGGDEAADRFFIAVQTTDEENTTVRFFVENGRSLEPAGCIAHLQEPGFGDNVVTGDLNSDGTDELLISTTGMQSIHDAVYVYDVPSLLAAASSADGCLGADFEPVATITPPEADKITCGETCRFGRAMAIGDIATDDETSELAIGAPQATVDGPDGKAKAGAVYIYRGENVMSGSPTLASAVVDSWPENGDEFGGGLLVAPMAGRQEMLIGSTGSGQVTISFCTGVGEDIEQGSDITKNKDGSVISTRCRI